MNTLEINGITSINSAKLSVIKQLEDESTFVKRENVGGQLGDHYTKNAANDSVVASILSMSINKSFDPLLSPNDKAMMPDNSQYDNQVLLHQSDLNVVADSILASLKNSATLIVENNGSSEDLAYFKEQASKGISAGVSLAVQDLTLLASEVELNKLTNLEESLQKRIHEISAVPEDYQLGNKYALKNGTDPQFNIVDITLASGLGISISFGTGSFQDGIETESSLARFTTAKNNVSFAITGEMTESELNDVADLVNIADSLTHKFYYSDINTLYDKALDKGYEKLEIIASAMHLRQKEIASPIRQYNAVKHLDAVNSLNDTRVGKEIADYVSDLYEFSDSVEEKFASRSEYKQIINGIVNQMKDVQVPDLLQAINRFHSFNSNFI